MKNGGYIKSARKGVAVYCLLKQPNGKYLFEQRSPSSKWQPGKWIFPGGKLDFGEEPEHAMVREIKEETGQKVKKLSLFFTESIVSVVKGHKLHIVRIYFYGEASGKIKLDGESCDYKILTLKQAKKLKLVPGLKRVITKFEKIKKQSF